MWRAELAQLFRSICPPPAPGAVVQRLLAVMTMVLIFALASALPSVAGFGGISFALRDDAQGRVFLGHGCVSSSPYHRRPKIAQWPGALRGQMQVL